MASDNEENTNSQQPEPAEEELDKTRMDIDASDPRISESTGTQAHLQNPDGGPSTEDKENTLDEVIKKKKFDVVGKFKELTGRFRLPKKSGRGPSLPFKWDAWLGWVIAILVGGALFFVLGQGVLQARGTPGILFTVLAASVAVTALLSLTVLVLRWPPAWFAGFPLVVLLLLVDFQILFWAHSPHAFFTLLGKNIWDVLNLYWIAFLLFEVGVFVFAFFKNAIARLFFLLPLFVLAGGFAYLEMHGTPVTSSWMGVKVLAQIPFFYLQPAYLTFEILLPALFLFAVVLLFLRKGNAAWIGVNVVALLLAMVLGFALLYEGRVPNAFSGVFKRPLEVGSAALLDEGNLFELTTANFESQSSRDALGRYDVQVKLFTGEKTDIHFGDKAFKVTLKDENGLPVFFMEQKDVRFRANGEAFPVWKWIPSGSSYLVAFRSDQVPPVKVEAPETTPPVEEVLAPRPLILPLDGDIFADQLTVIFSQPVVAVEPAAYQFFLDDQPQKVTQINLFQFIIDTKALPLGPHILKITQTSDSSTVVSLTLNKGTVPVLSILKPGLGEFVPAMVPVEVATQDSSQWGQLDLWLDQKKLTSWNQPPYQWIWKGLDLAAGTHWMMVTGKTKEGVQVSQAVSIESGRGGLHIPFLGSDILSGQEVGAMVLGYSNIVFVADASVSMNDVWQGKSKWDGLKEFFYDPSFAQLLQLPQVGLVTAGSGKSFKSKDCKDLAWISPLGEKGADAFGDLMHSKSPQGVLGLYQALEAAVSASEVKPDKIITFVDGADACSGSLTTKLKDEVLKGIQIDVVALGPLSPADQTHLEEVTTSTGGKLVSLTKWEELPKILPDLVLFNYTLSLAGETVLKSNLDGKSQELRTATYDLNFSASVPIEPMTVLVVNGQSNEYIWKNQDGKISLELAPPVAPVNPAPATPVPPISVP